MNITPVVRKFLTHRMRSIERYTDHAEDIQRGVLRRLVNAAEHTAYGKAFQFDKIRLYENFAQRVPLADYDSLKRSMKVVVVCGRATVTTRRARSMLAARIWLCFDRLEALRTI